MSNWKSTGSAPDHHGGTWQYYRTADAALGFQSTSAYKAEVSYNKTTHEDAAQQVIPADTHITAHVQYTDKVTGAVTHDDVRYYPHTNTLNGMPAGFPADLQQYLTTALQQKAQLD